MNILLLYYSAGYIKNRNTIDENLNSFRRYTTDIKWYYFNAANGIPAYLQLVHFDGIILHYTLLAARWNQKFFKKWKKYISRLKRLTGYKVAIPQDEYAATDSLRELFSENDVLSVFTCFNEDEYDIIYPPDIVPLKHRITVLPGYVDEGAVYRFKFNCLPHAQRSLDVGYRARSMPFWLGRHAQKKTEIAKRFTELLKGSELSFDISNRDQDVFYGSDWYNFLGRCRVVLGCEGGASLFDPDGAIRNRVEFYVRLNPDATFSEVERHCFLGSDFNIGLFTLSPRHFECAITKTCQVLLEGGYNGIFKPGKHFIEIKKDYSNLSHVLRLIQDQSYCEKMAERTYADIVQSGKYTYRKFVQQVTDHIRQEATTEVHLSPFQNLLHFLIYRYLNFREKLDPLLSPIFYFLLAIKIYRWSLFNKAKNKVTLYFQKKRADRVQHMEK